MSEPGTVKIKERWKGTYGGHYVYVVEGNTLVHISEYAREKLRESKNEIIYEVPLQKVSGKVLYVFNYSNSGGAFIGRCRIEDFEDGLPKRYEYFELLENRIHEIRNLRFQVKDPRLINLISEFNQLFTSMIREIREYEEEKGFKLRFMRRQRRLKDAFRDPELYYFTFMSLPSDKSRIKSLKVIRRWIYQLWVLKQLCECLRVSRFSYHIYEGKPYWWIEQGSDTSTCIGETPFGEVTFWLEFQPSKGAHLMGIFTDKRVAIRPDIVVVKGHFEWTKEFVDSKKAIDLLVECKEDPFEEWGGDIESQILPYLEYFKPSLFILASLKPVPVSAKSYLESRGIKVIDNLGPNSKSINTLCETLHRELLEKI